MYENVVLERTIFDFVTFEDIKITYTLGGDLQVVFTIDSTVNASTRDWVGIYQAGWTAFESCLTYHWGIGRHYQNSCRTRCMTFKARDISKAKLNTHYQFVYVSKYLEILGVSQYFQFCAPGTSLKGSSRQQTRSSVSFDPKPVNCKVSVGERVSNVFTKCGKCEKLFESNHGAKEYLDNLATLTTKVTDLERSVACLKMSVHPPTTQLWNEDAERAHFQKFLSDIYNPVRPDGSGEKNVSSLENRTAVHQRLISTIDGIISNAEKVKAEIKRFVDSFIPLGDPTENDSGMIDPNASGILPIPPVAPFEDLPKSEECLQPSAL